MDALVQWLPQYQCIKIWPDKSHFFLTLAPSSQVRSSPQSSLGHLGELEKKDGDNYSNCRPTHTNLISSRTFRLQRVFPHKSSTASARNLAVRHPSAAVRILGICISQDLSSQRWRDQHYGPACRFRSLKLTKVNSSRWLDFWNVFLVLPQAWWRWRPHNRSPVTFILYRRCVFGDSPGTLPV